MNYSSIPDEVKSASRSTQPHKFFERYLNNNLTVLAAELQDRYQKIEEAKVVGVTPVGENELWKSSNSVLNINTAESPQTKSRNQI